MALYLALRLINHQVCRERNDVSSDNLSFLMHGTERVFLVHFPMFHLARQRHQFIASVELSSEAMKVYKETKEKSPNATFVLNTQGKEDLTELGSKKNSFKASIHIQVSNVPPKT